MLSIPARHSLSPSDEVIFIHMPVTPIPDDLAALRRALDGRYDVERLLATGGMGSVYLGRDTTLDRPVAIKVIAPELAASAALRERFLREARTVARLRHPSIVAVYAAGAAEGTLYFVMEYVDGESVRQRLERDGAWRGPGAVAALRDLARALAYAHAHGIVHRDVKPENILVERDTGRALLTDFGVAQALAGGDESGRMTATGMVIGSPFYMSPEQAAGERALDGRSDIYSLGLVGYEMLAGAPVVQATSAATAIMKQLTERATALRLRAPDAPPAVADAIDRALEKDPANRWPDASAFADALDAGRSGTPVPPTTVLPAARPARRFAPLGLALAVLILLLAGWLLLGRRGRPGTLAGTSRNSYLVAPFEVLTGDPQVAWLREGSVSMLSLSLSQWTDLSVVDYERSLDLLREAKVGESARVSLEDARDMARRASVGTVVMGQITNTRDSLRVVARTYDVATGRKLDEAERAAAAGADPRPVFDALAGDLLDLAGAPAGVAASRLVETTTPSVEAYRAYLEGVRALNRWQLGRADTLFRRAIAADSTFALAYYRLASTIGWRNSGDSVQMRAVALAERYAGRSPPRERAIIGAYARLADALASYPDGATPRGDSLFKVAQAAYAQVIAHDSTDAEAWFGLGDAYYHHRPDGWAQPRTVANWNRALRAFARTLALDSTFYLAYSHKVDLYRWAAGQADGLMLDGDSLRVLDATVRRALGAERLERTREDARQRAMADARAWIRADPSPVAYVQLVWLLASTGRYDSAVVTLREAMARPETREAKTPFILAWMLYRVDPPAAYAELRKALAGANADELRAQGGGDLYEVLINSGTAAILAGRPADVEAVARLTERAAGKSYNFAAANGRAPRWWAAAARAGLGLTTPQVRADLEAAVSTLDVEQSDEGRARRNMFRYLPYVAYLATGEKRFADAARRWSVAGDSLPELDALLALRAGDTATARRKAAIFPNADSLVAAASGQSLARWIARARVLEALGDAPGALRWYDGLRPDRFSTAGPVEYAWALWPSALAAAGDLHARLGDVDAAREAYQRYLRMRPDPDPALRADVARVERALAALADRAPERSLPARP